MRTVLVLAQLLLAAGWLGAMSYSLLVVQPRAERFFRGPPGDDRAYEEFLTSLAAGNRWPVLGTIAGIAATEAALMVLALTGSAGQPGGTARLAMHLGKVGLLVAAAAVFWNVSWRVWPRRVFALEGELPGLRSAVRRSGVVIAVLAGGVAGLGALDALVVVGR